MKESSAGSRGQKVLQTPIGLIGPPNSPVNGVRMGSEYGEPGARVRANCEDPA